VTADTPDYQGLATVDQGALEKAGFASFLQGKRLRQHRTRFRQFIGWHAKTQVGVGIQGG
jgi:hypothetical protein